MGRMKELEIIRARTLHPIPHGFFGRRGGLSTGIYAGLNVGLGSNDDPDLIQQNRVSATNAISPRGALLTVHQIHSATAITAQTPWGDDARPQADALATDRPGLVLGILTADCAPVLMADTNAGVIGAAHAGWKGAISGITDATIAEMERLGADRTKIRAAIGPSIARASYEVSESFAVKFEDADPENERFFSPGKPGHLHFDLEGYVAHKLATAGIENVEMLGIDTYEDADRFFSYRRSCHRGEQGYGRQISLIGLPQ